MTARPAVKDEAAAHRFAKDHLKAFVERIERLEEEKKALADDIRDVYQEAKGNGFDVKALRAVVRMRKQDANERAEFDAILDTYLQALGMLGAETRARVEAIDRHGKMLAELDRAAQACAAAPEETIASTGLKPVSSAHPIEKAGDERPSPAVNSPSPPTGTPLGHIDVLNGGEQPPSLRGPGLCPGTSSDGADNSPSPSSSGGEQPRPVDRNSNPCGQSPDNLPGGAEFPDMPPFLRRGPNNEAAFVGTREARAPP